MNRSLVALALAGFSFVTVAARPIPAPDDDRDAAPDDSNLTSVIYGTSGPDVLMGTLVDDTINGRADADVMIGLTGNDTYIVDNVDDEVVEEPGAGTDTVRSSRNYFLPSNVENLVLTGSRSVYGAGNVLSNRIIGNGGSNRLSGGAGNDTMRGGGGFDTFWFSSALDGLTNVDRLPDFNVAEDRIMLHAGAFRAFLGLGSIAGLPPSYFHIGATATSASHHILYDPTTGALRYDGDGTGAMAAVRFAKLPTGLALTAGHFLVRSTAVP